MKFYRTTRNGGPAANMDHCDADCRRKIYCQQRNTVYFETRDCLGLKRMDLINNPLDTVMQMLGNPWYERHSE